MKCEDCIHHRVCAYYRTSIFKKCDDYVSEEEHKKAILFYSDMRYYIETNADEKIDKLINRIALSIFKQT